MTICRASSLAFFSSALLAAAVLAGAGGGAPARPAHADEHQHGAPAKAPTAAVAVLVPTAGNDVHGVVTFTKKEGGILVKAEVTGLAPGKHGFHVHEFGDLRSPDGMSAGGHFNPEGAPHALPDGAPKHVGDLGNIEADASGKATYERLDRGLAFEGPHSILGRGLVIHAQPDTGAQPVGNAGARVAVGVIGVAGGE
jgi:Cu-Zn family superoxide dismutase